MKENILIQYFYQTSYQYNSYFMQYFKKNKNQSIIKYITFAKVNCRIKIFWIKNMKLSKHCHENLIF